LERLAVLNPTGRVENQQTKAVSKLDRIDGEKIAFLDNLKPQSDQVLNGIRDLFEKWGVETAGFKKIDNPTPVPEIVVQEIRQKYHAMVTGVGD
jgi:hypothetical protein